MDRDKAHAVERFRKEPFIVVADQNFVIDSFCEGDELGIARLYFEIYGDEYPVDDYYVPERILQMNREAALCSTVCRTRDRTIVGHGALYRSSPPFSGLYEVGQYIVLPSYRKRGISELINNFVHDVLAARISADGIFGEAVTNHTITQRLDFSHTMMDYALELSLLPPGSGRDGAQGRVGCVVQFKTLHDREHTIYIPVCYRDDIGSLLEGADFYRTVLLSTQTELPQKPTHYQVRFFTGTGSVRFTFQSLGADFFPLIKTLEEQALKEGYVTMQSYFNLAEEYVGVAVHYLKSQGWILGGYLPRWFDSDGLLMQKVMEPPDFAAIQLYSPKAKAILIRMQREYQESLIGDRNSSFITDEGKVHYDEG